MCKKGLMISTSPIRISIVVEGSQVDAAVRCLHTAFFHTIFGHQAFVALQQFTDFADHTERDNFIFKSFFAQFDSVVALFDYFYLIHIAVFNYLHADHLLSDMYLGKGCIAFLFHKQTSSILY